MTDMSTFSQFSHIKLKCGVEDCQFGPFGPTDDGFITEVRGPENLTLNDTQLLNNLLDNAPEQLTPAQVERLNVMLNDRLECPTHGRTALGFGTTVKVIAEAEFEIKLGKEPNKGN